MNREKISKLFAECEDQLRIQLHRGGSIQEAVDMLDAYRVGIVNAIPSMDDFHPFVKDIAIALAPKLTFDRHELLEGLVSGNQVSLDDLRASHVVKIGGSVAPAWRHIVSTDPYTALLVIAIAYRMWSEETLKKLLQKEHELVRILEQQKQGQTELQEVL